MASGDAGNDTLAAFAANQTHLKPKEASKCHYR